MLKVNNIFYSIQGEGIHSGIPTIFIRFAGCPFRCPYCDEPSALTEHNSKEYEPKELGKEILRLSEKHNCSFIEYTGGSPEAQDNNDLLVLSRYLKRLNINLSMQMSGGLELKKSLWYIIDSHKIDYKELSCNIPFIIKPRLLTLKDEIKFVLDADFENYEWFKDRIKIFENSSVNIIVSSKTTSRYPNDLENTKKITERILNDNDINKEYLYILPRLHQLYWPNVKGV